MICPLGLIEPYKPFQPEITATYVALEAKNVPLRLPQTWGFQAKNDTPLETVLDPLRI